MKTGGLKSTILIAERVAEMAWQKRERYRRGERAEIGHLQCGKGGRNGQGGKGALQAGGERRNRPTSAIFSAERVSEMAREKREGALQDLVHGRSVGRSVGVPSQTQSKLRPKVAIII